MKGWGLEIGCAECLHREDSHLLLKGGGWRGDKHKISGQVPELRAVPEEGFCGTPTLCHMHTCSFILR